MLEDQKPQDSNISRLHCVTAFSKYLAIVLFIITPFVGGFLGYKLAPEKVTEVEKVVVKEIAPDNKFEIKGTCPLTSDIFALAAEVPFVSPAGVTLFIQSHSDGPIAQYHLPNSPLGGVLWCQKLVDETHVVQYAVGHLGTSFYTNLVLDNTGQLIKDIDVYNDSNGGWGAKKSIDISSSEYFYKLRDETIDDGEKRVVLMSFSQDKSCQDLQECLASEYLLGIISDTMHQYDKNKSSFSYSHKILDTDTIELIAQRSPMSAGSAEELYARTGVALTETLDI